MRLTRLYRFSASHRLHSERLSETENRDLYGKCNNPFGHGHDYTLEVSVSGTLDPATGRLMHTEALDRLVRDEVLSAFDHRNLNVEVPAFAEAVPTSENLAVEIRRRLAARWDSLIPSSGAALDRVRLQETRNNIFEVSGTT